MFKDEAIIHVKAGDGGLARHSPEFIEKL